MNLYTIGQAVDKFNSPTSVAVSIKGDMKGTMIYVDMDNDGKLTTIYPDGDISDVICIRYSPEIPREEQAEWVMLEELEGDTSDLAIQVLGEVLVLQQRLFSNFMTGLQELTEEEQGLVVSELEEYAKNFLK